MHVYKFVLYEGYLQLYMIYNRTIQHIRIILWQSIHMQAIALHIDTCICPSGADIQSWLQAHVYVYKGSRGACTKFCTVKSTLTYTN